MDKREYSEIVRLLKGSYRFLMQEQDQIMVWWTWLKDYTFEEAKSGVTQYIMNNTREPNAGDIVNAIEKARDANRYRQQYDANQRMGHCPHCRDTGLIVTESPTGIKQGRPCEMCERGRQRYPFWFIEDKDEWYKDHPEFPRPYEAPQSFVDTYVYGVKK